MPLIKALKKQAVQLSLSQAGFGLAEMLVSIFIIALIKIKPL